RWLGYGGFGLHVPRQSRWGRPHAPTVWALWLRTLLFFVLLLGGAPDAWAQPAAPAAPAGRQFPERLPPRGAAPAQPAPAAAPPAPPAPPRRATGGAPRRAPARRAGRPADRFGHRAADR